MTRAPGSRGLTNKKPACPAFFSPANAFGCSPVSRPFWRIAESRMATATPPMGVTWRVHRVASASAKPVRCPRARDGDHGINNWSGKARGRRFGGHATAGTSIPGASTKINPGKAGCDRVSHSGCEPSDRSHRRGKARSRQALVYTFSRCGGYRSASAQQVKRPRSTVPKARVVG